MPGTPQINRNECLHHGFRLSKGASEHPNVILSHLPALYRKTADQPRSVLISGPYLDVIFLSILP